MTTPTISVVIPTRNRAQYIKEAIDSVLIQTYKDYEIIIVDDGSIDETTELLAPLVHKKVIQYQRQDAAGVSSARNRGVALARGHYIAFLDSDDLFQPTKLEEQLLLFEQEPELGFVHCCFSKFDDYGRDLGIRNTSRFYGQIYPWMLQEWSVLMAMPCMLVRTEVMKEVSGFDESMAWAEDMDLWRRIAQSYRVGVVPKALVRVRVHADSTTYEKSGSAKGFKQYLDKAFTDDPDLGATFKRRTYGKMYAKLAQNLLGEGGTMQMRLVRQHCGKALAAWPLELGAVIWVFASFLPTGIRHSLANWFRRGRYPIAQA